jgi:hypothetical protein
VGFDASGHYLLTITHSGRGVFSTTTWERVARDTELAYPENGIGVGIGPIAGHFIHVTDLDIDIDREELHLTGPNGQLVLACQSDGISVLGRDL